MAKCGAHSKSTGNPCKAQAMANGRCKNHGGKTPETNQNAVKHGFYSKCYTEDEKNDLDQIGVGTLEAELLLAKTQLRRAASAPEFMEDGTTPNKNYRPDVTERLLAIVGRLEKQHHEITHNTPSDPDETPPTSITVEVVDGRKPSS